MTAPASSRWDHEVRSLAFLALCVAMFSFLAFFRRGEVLLYGDAVAHINIARRVFDSKTPGLLQLGTVWLPLPHLLMIPFLISQKMWQEGSGGSIPSLIAYVFAVIGLFRLVRGVLLSKNSTNMAARIGAWVAAAVFGANPNLIYMQTTAMGEALYLAFFIWAVLHFSEALRGEEKSLLKCGLCLFAACLTRYDGWFLAVIMACVAIFICLRQKRKNVELPAFSRNGCIKFILIAAAAPAIWLAYNATIYRNALEFANGPYSARAIEKRTQTPGSPGHPGTGNLYASAQYFLKSAEFNVAENQALQRVWLLLGLTAIAIPIVRFSLSREQIELSTRAKPALPISEVANRALAPLLFLLTPIPFYALSVAYSGVPIFIPAWWPFTHYNVRYGLQLLPALAAAAGMLVYYGWNSNAWHGLLRRASLLFVLAFTFASYATVWQARPICLREAQINMRGRTTLETRLAAWLQVLPPNSTLLMYVGDHVGAVERAGLPLSRVINEGNHRVWRQPNDPQGLWEQALADPVAHSDFILAFENDPVWQAVQGRHLPELVEINVSGQARAILYRAR